VDSAGQEHAQPWPSALNDLLNTSSRASLRLTLPDLGGLFDRIHARYALRPTSGLSLIRLADLVGFITAAAACKFISSPPYQAPLTCHRITRPQRGTSPPSIGSNTPHLEATSRLAPVWAPTTDHAMYTGAHRCRRYTGRCREGLEHLITTVSICTNMIPFFYPSALPCLHPSSSASRRSGAHGRERPVREWCQPERADVGGKRSKTMANAGVEPTTLALLAPRSNQLS
jgi:hypothetical protein